MKGKTNALPISVDRGEERVNLVLTLDGGDTDALYGASILITDADTGVSQTLIYDSENANVFSITAGHRYTVDCKKYGQNLPPVIKEYTAINNYTRKLTLDYYTPPVGAYIYTVDDRLWTPDTYVGDGSDAIGVYVGDSSHRYIFQAVKKSKGIDNKYDNSYFDSSTTYGWPFEYSEAIMDFDGKGNTTRLSTSSSSSYVTLKSCANYTFINGKSAYIPALGQIIMLHNNQADVMACLGAIGNTIISTSQDFVDSIISSTAGKEYDSDEGEYSTLYRYTYVRYPDWFDGEIYSFTPNWSYKSYRCFVCCDFE